MFPGFGQQIVRFHEGKLFIFQFNRFSDNLARVSSGILSPRSEPWMPCFWRSQVHRQYLEL